MNNKQAKRLRRYAKEIMEGAAGSMETRYNVKYHSRSYATGNTVKMEVPDENSTEENPSTVTVDMPEFKEVQLMHVTMQPNCQRAIYQKVKQTFKLMNSEERSQLTAMFGAMDLKDLGSRMSGAFLRGRRLGKTGVPA